MKHQGSCVSTSAKEGASPSVQHASVRRLHDGCKEGHSAHSAHHPGPPSLPDQRDKQGLLHSCLETGLAITSRSQTPCVEHALWNAIDFANFDFGQFRLRPMSTSANLWMLNFWITKGPRRVGGPEGWEAQNFAFSFPSSGHNFLSSFSLLGSFRGILVVFEARGS